MNNRPPKIGIVKPKTGGNFGVGRQDLKSRLSNHILGNQSTHKRSSTMNASGTAKRPKLDFRSVGAVNLGAGPSTSSTSTLANASSTSAAGSIALKLLNIDASWMEFSADIEVSVKTFEAVIAAAKEKNKPNRMARTVCAAVKSVLSGDDPLAHKEFITQIINSVKEEERLLKSNNVFLALLQLLNTINSTQATLQTNSLITLLTQMTTLMENWPLATINYALNDSLGARNWVDRPNANNLLFSVCSIFGSLTFPSEQTCQACDLPFIQREPFEEQSKFNKSTEEINTALRTIYDYFEKQAEPTKNTLKTLALCTADAKIRVLVVKKLDSWLQNGKLQRQAMELLLHIAVNLRDSYTEDNLETILCLVGLRALRSKLVMNVFQVALKDILTHCPGACSVLITVMMENEFQPMKLQHNMSILQSIYNFNFAETSEAIAKYLITRLENPDAIRSVRVFLRDFVRSSVRAEFSFVSFAKAMFATFRASIVQVSQHIQDMLFRAFIDVCATLPFLGITPLIKETVQLKKSSVNAALLQPQSANQDSVTKFHTQLNGFMLCVLDFLKWAGRLIAYSFYTTAENWPLETEFNQFMKVIAECPIEETLVMDLIDIGTASPSVQRHSLLFSDVLSILEALTKRSLSIRGFENENNPLLIIKSPHVIDKLFKLSIYNVEDSLTRPLALKNLYWKTWFLTTVWACLNRNTLLKTLYEKFPTLRMILHMAVTKDYYFPPPGVDNLSASRIIEDDERELAAERKILKTLNVREAFDDASSSNSGSGQNTMVSGAESSLPICFFNPSGVSRRPLNFFVDYLRQCNDQYTLHFALCSLRSPDILQCVLRDQGAERTLPAVVHMVSNNASLIESAIPLQCLCQLMLLILQQNLGFESQLQQSLQEMPSFSENVQSQIVSRLRDNILNSKNVKSVETIINFLLTKLASPIFDEREVAINLIQHLLKEVEREEDDDCIIVDNEIGIGENLEDVNASIFLLTKICFFDKLKNNICQSLGKCCIIENIVARILQYIKFISKHAGSDVFHSIAACLSSLVKRTSDDLSEHKSVRDCLTNFYALFIRKLEVSSNAGSLTSIDSVRESNLLIAEENLLHISIEEPKMEFEINSQIISAIMELLSEAFCNVRFRSTKYPQHQDDDANEFNSREYLMKIFFPKCGSNLQHLTVTKSTDRNQVVDILPPYLKMKMLSANDERIVKVALEDVTPEQSLDFIQSFALSPFSCSRLLAVLNNSELGRCKKAIVAIPFVRAYKLKGAEGCDLFLANMESFAKSILISKEDSKAPVKLPPFQSFHHTSEENTKEGLKKKSLYDFSLPTSATEYLNDVLTEVSNLQKKKEENTEESDAGCKKIDSKIISSQTFRIFLASVETQIRDAKHLNESIQYAKALITFIAQKIQIFAQKLPNTLSAILFVLIDVCSQNNSIRSFLTNLSERVERICPNANFVSSFLYRFNSKHLSNAFNNTVSSKKKGIVNKFKLNNTDLKMLLQEVESDDEVKNGGVIGKLTKLFAEEKLSEQQMNDLLEQYYILHPQIFSSLNTKPKASSLEAVDAPFNEEVFALFSSNCLPILDFISQITVYSSLSTIQRVMNTLLQSFNKRLIALSVINFVENSVISNSSKCRHLPTPNQVAVLFDYVLAELLKRFFENKNLTDVNKVKVEKSNRKLTNNKSTKNSESDWALLSQPILVQFTRILSGIFEESDIETYVERDCEARNGKETLKMLKNKVAECEKQLKLHEIIDDERRQKLKMIELIADSINKKFPGFYRNTVCNNSFSLLSMSPQEISLFSMGNRKQLFRPIELLSINDFDNILHQTITDLISLIKSDFYGSTSTTAIRLTVKQQPQQETVFSGATSDLINGVIDKLIKETKEKPQVLARQIPLLSIYTSAIMQKSTRQFRDSLIFKRVLELTLDVIIYTAPYSLNDTVAIDYILQSYFTFFEAFGYRRSWSEVAEKCLRFALKFLEQNVGATRNLLTKNAGIVRLLVTKVVRRLPEAHTLIENLQGFCAYGLTSAGGANNDYSMVQSSFSSRDHNNSTVEM